MIVLGFTVLALVLYAAALTFAFLLVRTQFREESKRIRRSDIRAQAQLRRDIETLRTQLANLETRPPTKDGTLAAAPAPLNQFQKSEQRHLKELGKVINIGDTPTPVG